MIEARLHVVIQGMVQGVGFRYFVIRKAQELGLRGWVRNQDNNKVETIAEGPKDALNAFLEELRAGPTSSRVTNVNVEWCKPLFDFKDFGVRHDEW